MTGGAADPPLGGAPRPPLGGAPRPPLGGVSGPPPPGDRSGTGGPAELYWEDLTPGRHFDLGVTEVDRTEMLAFARRYDPQWYHLDEQLAAASEYGDVIASGFFTVSLFMRAYVDGLLARAAAAASPGLEELRWLAPVYAGDRLAVGLEVLASGPSRSRPECGTVTLLGTMTRLATGDRPAGSVPSTAPAGHRPAGPVLRTQFRGWFLHRAATPAPAADRAGGEPTG